MKTYKTAKAILRHSLEDIERGLWTCGTLCQVAPYEDDHLSAEAYKDPMGCALGLVAMHGGDTEPRRYYLGIWPNGTSLYFDSPKYATEHSPKGVLEAVDALFRTVPKKVRDEYLWNPDGGEPPIESKNTVVYNYNDQESMTRRRAAQWFRRALESVS